MAYQFTDQDKSEHLATLGAVARHIDEIIAEGKRDQDALQTMRTNVRHIGIMCAMPHLAGEDLEPYRDAQARGSAWLRV